MKLIPADHHRSLQIPGVPSPVARPVDIDAPQTGFTTLRTLRIYRFDAGSVIDGHAEEDEVLIVVLAGSIELTLIDSNDNRQLFTLSAPSDAPGAPCAAYLPPHAAYRMVPHTAADVAYARATPASGPPPAVFRSHAGAALLFEEVSYPQLLRVRMMHIADATVVAPIEEAEDSLEALIHVRTAPGEGVATLSAAGSAPLALASWDTVAVAPGERPALRVAEASQALVLIVLAG